MPETGQMVTNCIENCEKWTNYEENEKDKLVYEKPK